MIRWRELIAVWVLIIGTIQSSDANGTLLKVAFQATLSNVQGKSERIIPPAVIYHYGHKPYLIADAQLGTIAQDVWDKNIMGESSRYKLPKFRRGLYGSTNPGDAEYYGHLSIGTEQIPWLMAIEIKSECREPTSVADVANLNRDSRFESWFNTQRPSGFRDLKEFGERCLGTGVIGPGKDLAVECQESFDKFLTHGNIKTVVDNHWDDSWYLRDRSCIAGIRALPEDILKIMASVEFWKDPLRRSSGPYIRPGAAAFLVLIDSLVEAENVDSALLEELIVGLERSEISTYPRNPGDKVEYWVRNKVPWVVRGYFRSAETGDLENFRRPATKLLTVLRDPKLFSESRLQMDQVFDRELNLLLETLGQPDRPKAQSQPNPLQSETHRIIALPPLSNY